LNLKTELYLTGEDTFAKTIVFPSATS